MSFDIPIEIKPGTSRQTIASIGVEIDKLEQKGKKAGSSLDDALAGIQRQFEAMRAAAGRTAGALQNSFAGMADALKRTEGVLERIHGPMREHERDLQALNLLYRQGRVSAAEFHIEVDRMNAAIGRTPKPGVGSSILGALPGGAAVAGGAAGLAAAGVGAAVGAAHEIGQMADAYTNLENRLQKVATSETNHAHLMERTRQIANASRSEWAATGETFVRLTKATGDLGLSQDRTLRLTETISKAFSQSGASATESSAAMLQLTQAFASGKLAGDEFRSLAESVPDVLDFIAKEMGVSRGALKQLGSEGKITSAVLVSAFEHAQSSIDAGFAKSAPTLSQQWQVFKNEATDAIGKLAKDSDLLPYVTEKLQGLGVALERVATAAGAISQIRKMPGISLFTDSPWDLDALESRLKTIGDPAGERGGRTMMQEMAADASGKETWEAYFNDANQVAAREAYIIQIQRIANEHARLQEVMGDAAAKGGMATDALAIALSKMTMAGVEDVTKFGDAFYKTFSNLLPNSVDDAVKALGGLSKETSTFVGDAMLQLTLFLNKGVLPKSMDSWAVKSKGGGHRAHYNAPMRDNVWEYSGAERVQQGIDAFMNQPGALGGQLGNASGGALTADIEKATSDALETAERAFKQMTDAWERELRLQKAAMGQWERGVTEGWDAVRKQATDVSGAITAAMTNAYKGVEDAIVSLATTGKASFSDLVNTMLADLARLATRQLFMSLLGLGTGGTASVFGTGATQAFSGLYGGGHASGGAWKAPSTGGGPDSIPVMFHMSPGETAHFTPQGQSASGGGGTTVVNQIQIDERQLAAMIDTPGGRKAIANVIRLNPGLAGPFGRR